MISRDVGKYLDSLALKLASNAPALAFIRSLPRRQSSEQIAANSGALLALLEQT